MKLEQAVFTSVRGASREGYQVAAISPGVTPALSRELSRWGPAHDSLNEERGDALSVNFHVIDDDLFCVSKTSAGGEEYSGRGGARVYTQMFLIGRDDLARFANNPFRLLEAVQALGKIEVLKKMPERLESIQLAGRSRAFDARLKSWIESQLGPDQLQRLTAAARTDELFAVSTSLPADQLFAGMLEHVDVDQRRDISFATGLLHSSRRPFRLIALPADRNSHRGILRKSGRTLLDLAEEPVAASK